MMFMNPIITLFFSLSFSGSLALYWAAGNFVMIIQQLIVTFIITPHEKERVAREMKARPVEVVVTQKEIDQLFSNNSTGSNQDNKTQELHQNLRKRNQGKQKRPRH